MKAMMALGGLLGFVMGCALALSQRSGWPDVLWRASTAALACGLLMRWWGKLWIQSLREAQLDKMEKAKVEAKKLAGSSKS